ncbi:MAG: NAD(P)/FAD-dependent oxidoreductase [Thermodesulfobacteriota bacterium]|nr:NAD(P)/FAD-dependent oxidoreductase [Thermodesulfobacteriota bacterium]
MKQENYDVVVIGAGIGGLSAASLLAHRGYKTLVVERLPFVGGRCSNVEHNGFMPSTGAIAIEGEIKDVVFDELGIPFNVVSPQPQFYYYIDGKFHEVPDKGKLRAAINIASGKKEADKVMDAMKHAITWLAPPDSISLHDWLLQYTQNERTIGVFHSNFDTNVMPAGEFFRIIKRLGALPMGYAVGGNIALMESLADVVRKNGDVRKLWQVDRIVVEDGVAKGVIIRDRKGEDEDKIQVNCKVVVSNTGPKMTVKLAGEENFERGYIAQMKETLKLPASWTTFQLASDEPLVDHSSIIAVCNMRRVNWINCPTIICPELAPEGKHLTYGGGWVPSEGPPFDMDKELELNMEDMREIFPDFDKRAEIIHVGFFMGGWPMYHAWFGKNMPRRTPVVNLYNVGDGAWVEGTYGLIGCAISGKVVADEIQERIKA